MKTTLIQIDPHDDLTSIKDKMTWSNSPRMVLFFPNGYPLDQSPLTMKLIKRYAEANGARVALVTRNRIMRVIAEEQGIPCFESAPEAEKKVWRGDLRISSLGTMKGLGKITEKKAVISTSPKKKHSFQTQKFVTFILLFGLLILSFILFVPSAQVILYPEVTPQQLTYSIIADPDANSIAITGMIPADVFTIEISGELAGDSSGKVVVPKGKAIGEVELINLTSESVLLPRGTIVSTGGAIPIDFILTTEVYLPESSVESQIALIEAVVAGESGNVGSGKIIQISGLEQLVSINNPEPISGGTEQSFPTPTLKDYDKLEIQLRNQLLEKCEESVADQNPQEKFLIEKSIKLGESLSTLQTPIIGAPSDRAILALTINCSALMVSLEDERQLAKRLLDQNLTEDLIPVNDEITVEPTTDVFMNRDGKFTWDETASRDLMQPWDTDKGVTSLTGKRISEVNFLLLSSFSQLKPPEVTIMPSWWKVMPLLPARINVEIRSE